MEFKPGFKTTEFWVTIATQVIGLTATTGYLTPAQADVVGQAAIQVGGLVAMLGSAFGYSLSRAKAKAGQKH